MSCCFLNLCRSSTTNFYGEFLRALEHKIDCHPQTWGALFCANNEAYVVTLEAVFFVLYSFVFRFFLITPFRNIALAGFSRITAILEDQVESTIFTNHKMKALDRSTSWLWFLLGPMKSAGPKISAPMLLIRSQTNILVIFFMISQRESERGFASSLLGSTKIRPHCQPPNLQLISNRQISSIWLSGITGFSARHRKSFPMSMTFGWNRKVLSVTFPALAGWNQTIDLDTLSNEKNDQTMALDWSFFFLPWYCGRVIECFPATTSPKPMVETQKWYSECRRHGRLTIAFEAKWFGRELATLQRKKGKFR